MQVMEYNWSINSKKTSAPIQHTYCPNNQQSKIFNSEMAIKWLAAGKAKAKLETCRHMIALDNKRLQPKSQMFSTKKLHLLLEKFLFVETSGIRDKTNDANYISLNEPK